MEEQEQRKRISCGLEYSAVPQLKEQLFETTNRGFHFMVVPFIHPRYKRELISGKCMQRQEPLSRSDLILNSQDWNRLIVGKISPYFEIDSEIEHVRKTNEAQFLQELEFANHLSLPAILLPLRSGNCINMAKILYARISGCCTYQVWVQVPMVAKKRIETIGNVDTDYNSWEWWNKFRIYCDYDKKLGLALELSQDMPSDQDLERWLGEPVKCLIINTNLFLTNQREYPVLSKSHQQLLRRFFQLDVQYIIKGKNVHSSYSQYWSYINYLGKKLYESSDFTEFIQGCEDYLQNPLQPLSENLETLVYEVFEKDPHKYNQYQLAIQRAVEDKTADDPNKELVVMVVGAGRGPLIRAVLNAAELTGCKLQVYAIEKNPHAVNTLQALVRELWPGKVTVFFGDMRSFTPNEKADILISELLGSFGDNELSPECLDGAQRFLKEDGVSIPTSYTSWVAPIQSIKLFNEIRNTRPADKTLLNCFETPYVVHIVNNYRIDNTKELFTFSHPNKDAKIDNRRYEILRFKSSQNCVLTGFAGYFSCDLYKGVMISTEPNTHTKEMMSWFPIYFPIYEPIQIKAGDNVEVAFWRCVSQTKVWYEWCVMQPKIGPLHNPTGRSYTISK